MGSNLFPTPSIFFIFSQYFPKHGKRIFAPWGVPLRWVEHKVIIKQVLSWFDGASIADIESRQDTHSQNLGDDPGKERRADGRIGSEQAERRDIAGFFCRLRYEASKGRAQLPCQPFFSFFE